MENRARQMIEGALLLDFAETDSFDPAGYDYQFSGKFEAAMERIFAMADRAYVSVGRRRIRRAAALALAAALIMATAVCGVAVTKPLVKWLTSQNEEEGALEIQFEIDDPNDLTGGEFIYIVPEIPEGYEIVTEQEEKGYFYVEYKNEADEVIYFSQSTMSESRVMGMDNETGELNETLVNGNQGYEWSNGKFHSLTWSNGIYLFDLAGICEIDQLYKIAESIR